jgi:hypothetical protein
MQQSISARILLTCFLIISVAVYLIACNTQHPAQTKVNTPAPILTPTPIPPLTLTPVAMQVPAGASSFVSISIPANSDSYRDGRGHNRWFVDELPPGTTFRFYSQPTPFKTVLRLDTIGMTSEGHYDLAVQAYFSNTVWIAPVELTVRNVSSIVRQL